MKPVILWTDALVWLLVAVIVISGFYMRSRPHLREPWQRVIRSRMGMSALVVLLAFVLIGLLDSLHFREALPPQPGETQVHYAGETLSVFDKLVGPLRTRVEKTYSAPFSAWLYMKEMVTRPDGSQVMAYPRLEYGAAHLDDPLSERGGDIALRLGLTTLQTLLAMALVILVVAGLVARRYRHDLRAALSLSLRGGTVLPLPTLLITLAVLVWLLFAAINLAGAYHVFGTDKVGQDVLYQALKSIRTGLVIGTLTTLIMLPFAVLLGIMAGYFRGWVDDVIQYLYTTLNSIPGVLLIAAAVLMMQVYMNTHPELFQTMAERADLRLLFLCIILGVTSWTGLCRMLRGETLKLREMDYIQAATAFGVPHFVVILRHILPNVMHIVLIAVVLDFSGLVLAEAVLSYVGVGVDPTMNSWGNMINRARLEMAREPMVWWSLLAAFIFMFTLVLAANLFSDVVRDAFDPRLREQK